MRMFSITACCVRDADESPNPAHSNSADSVSVGVIATGPVDNAMSDATIRSRPMPAAPEKSRRMTGDAAREPLCFRTEDRSTRKPLTRSPGVVSLLVGLAFQLSGLNQSD